ncbi:MAG: type I-E CRISPR-associated protein Cas5/CasD [Micropruina sp.]|nr:type I-E CRISPR-associated protein Cas5/CasD [Micropruina sp.]
MTVLLLRLAGPLQSWGDSSRFARRETRAAPTKSGVLGLLAAADGRRRTDEIEDLANLRFGVRVDQPGQLVRDFQTAINWDTQKSMPLSERYYLADAVFVAGVEGDGSLIQALADRLEDPIYPLYLGRRSCPTAGRLSLGVRAGPLESEIRAVPWQAADWHRRTRPKTVQLPLYADVTDGLSGATETVRDVPLSFSPERREYGWREVAHLTPVHYPNPAGRKVPDWLAALEA